MIIGDEAHIRAQSTGGPRYDPNYEDVDGYDNLMLMCPSHHRLIDADNGAGFSVDTLLDMKSAHEASQRKRDAVRDALNAYVGDRYAAENTVQFHQVDLRGPSVDSMFVDVPVGCRRDGSPVAALVEDIAKTSPGDTGALESTTGLAVVGATQALLDPRWTGHAVIVGGPGQGKSTLLQFLCQYFRARRLGEDAYTGQRTDLARAGSPARFPIRVELRKYVKWALDTPPRKHGKGRKKRDAGANPRPWRSLEEYMIEEIRTRIGAHSFEPDDFVHLMTTEPTLIALDGLDEVASVNDRALVISEISRMRGRLGADAADMVILVTTRPGSALQPLTSSGAFATLHLQKLTPGLRLQFLDRWVVVAGLTEESATRLRSTFLDSQNVPHIDELASYPMQLAILLHLLDRRQLLPQQRTELYEEYLKTFLDREQTEDKEPLLAAQRRVIEDTHAFLGWHLQAMAEQGHGSGRITRAGLRDALRTYLRGQPKELELADELYSALTDRVLCLVERDDAFEFEVQSLREYFAARHLFDNLTAKGHGNSRDDGLNALLERPYWSNVSRFFIGMLARGEIRALQDNFQVVEGKVAPQPLVRAMAALVLSDRIFDGLRDRDIQPIVDFVLDGPGVVFAVSGAFDPSGWPLMFGVGAGRDQAIRHLKSRLEVESSDDMRALVADSLGLHAHQEEVADWWWDRHDPSAQWLDTAARLGILWNLDEERSEQLARSLSTPPSKRWHVDQLGLGAYGGNDDRILDYALADLNEGAIDVVGVTQRGRGLSRLVVATSSALMGPVLNRRDSPADESAPTSEILTRVERASSELRARHMTPVTSPEWSERLHLVADGWGDGWVLWQAVGDVPLAVDLDAIATTARSQVLADACRAENAARANRGNLEWWRSLLIAAREQRALAHAVVSVLRHTRSQVLVALASQLDSAIGRLDPLRFRVVEHALVRGMRAGRGRSVDVQQALRLKQLTLSGRALWLLSIVSTDATKERIAPQLAMKLDDALGAGTTHGAAIVTLSNTGRKLNVSQLEGARSAFEVEPWGDVPVTGLPASLEKRILRNPERWPSLWVSVAIELAARRSSEKAPSLATVARENHWFPATD
ncbi:HNH endonuclease [Microbacterium hydrocarbonoxydans]|uniref:HNH endonuclease n=1 Tax=Microbacterium hydrocarbonoxydans TaxID=273678 RepID=UPI001FB9F61C|nr:HNH endonuclease [Microbacterium hydrocarbonoxydans]